MSAVPLRNNKAVAAAARTVTVLGATGSIGDSTMDLLRGARDRYEVEALTAFAERMVDPVLDNDSLRYRPHVNLRGPERMEVGGVSTGGARSRASVTNV